MDERGAVLEEIDAIVGDKGIVVAIEAKVWLHEENVEDFLRAASTYERLADEEIDAKIFYIDEVPPPELRKLVANEGIYVAYDIPDIVI